MSGAIIALVVEGHGDVYATPVLVRRLVESRSDWVQVLQPHRVPKSRMSQDLNRAIRLQSDRVGTAPGGVLVLVDADSDNPQALEQSLLDLIDDDLRDRVRVAIAVKEYEAWFLAGLESLRQHRSVLDNASYPGDPEMPRDAKGRLAEQMTESYQETIHQAAFSAIVDVSLVRERSASFHRLDQHLRDLIDPLSHGRLPQQKE